MGNMARAAHHTRSLLLAILAAAAGCDAPETATGGPVVLGERARFVEICRQLCNREPVRGRAPMDSFGGGLGAPQKPRQRHMPRVVRRSRERVR